MFTRQRIKITEMVCSKLYSIAIHW